MQRRTFLVALSTSSLLPALRLPVADAPLGTIVFVQEDGLWLRELPAGELKRLTTGARIRSPRLSPSGQWIAYQSGPALHVIHRDGSRTVQLPAGKSVWKRDRDVLAVTNSRGLAFFSSENGWKAPITLYEVAGLPIFSPDGTQFVYASVVERRNAAGEPMRDGQLCAIGLTGSERRVRILSSQRSTNLTPCGWTRDSKSVLYWEDPDWSASAMADGLELFQIAADGGSARSLRVMTLVHHDLLALSPVRNALAVTAGAGRQTWSGKRIGVIDLETAALHYLTGETRSAISPAWSPDGKRIAYTAGPETGVEEMRRIRGGDEARRYLGQRRIWVADASATTYSRQLTSDNDYRDEQPVWSAGGTHILFCRMDRDNAATLWTMSANGENPVRVSGRLALDDGWFGYYGYIDWGRAFDWFRHSA
jgi:hypothetical protein